MKKQIAIIVLTLIVGAQMVMGTPVSVERARLVARNFLKLQGAKAYEGLREVTAETGSEHMYVFTGKDCFAVVSADDWAHPVLGYSTEEGFDEGHMSPGARYWLGCYAEQIAKAKGADAEIAAEWEALTEGRMYEAKGAESVSALLTTKWGQDFPYNKYCPITPETGTHAPTGCVATAMGQIMRYWEWPEHGKGSHTYSYADKPEAVEEWPYGDVSWDFEHTTFDWEHMPNKITAQSDSAEIEAVSRLLSACGVAFDMMYGKDGSGAFLLEENVLYDTTKHIDVEAAVEHRAPRFLDYAESLAGEMRMDHTDEEWVEMMKTDLSGGYPLIYTGFKFNEEGIAESGHAFVLDGYNKLEYFHINWGWDGSQNGHFKVSAMNIDAYGYSFNDRQGAIFGLKPSRLQKIAEAAAEGWKVWGEGRTIAVRGAEGKTVEVYDVMGRRVTEDRTQGAERRYRMAKSGVYVVRIGGKAEKIYVR